MYDTGDIAKWLPDGNIAYIGRNDFQIKINGQRIELGEIENSLLEIPNIKESIVIAKEKNTNQKYLIAYITLYENNTISEEQIRAELKRKLPDLIPSVFIILDEMPLNPNGKIDRKVLPEPEIKFDETEYIAPQTQTEKQLAEIWQEVLGIKKISTTTNLFEIGTTSITAIQISNKIPQITPTDIYQHPTIQNLAQLITNQQEGKETTNQTPHLIKICEGEPNSTPIFFIGGGGGAIGGAENLAETMNKKQRIIGCALPPFTDYHQAATELATEIITYTKEHNIEKIKIGGFCAGNTLAFLIANKLIEQGIKVELTIIAGLEPSHYEKLDATNTIIGFMRDNDGLSGISTYPEFCNQINIDPNNIEAVEQKIREIGEEKTLEIYLQCFPLEQKMDITTLQQTYNTYKQVPEALYKTELPPYLGKKVTILPADNSEHLGENAEGWFAFESSQKIINKFAKLRDNYNGWGEHFDEDCEVTVIELKGSHFRAMEDPNCKDMQTIAEGFDSKTQKITIEKAQTPITERYNIKKIKDIDTLKVLFEVARQEENYEEQVEIIKQIIKTFSEEEAKEIATKMFEISIIEFEAIHSSILTKAMTEERIEKSKEVLALKPKK